MKEAIDTEAVRLFNEEGSITNYGGFISFAPSYSLSRTGVRIHRRDWRRQDC